MNKNYYNEDNNSNLILQYLNKKPLDIKKLSDNDKNSKKDDNIKRKDNNATRKSFIEIQLQNKKLNMYNNKPKKEEF